MVVGAVVRISFIKSTAFDVAETQGAAIAPMCSALVRDLIPEVGFAMIGGGGG